MEFAAYLDHEWIPALGCTEPAAIAMAASRAAALADGPVRRAHLVCDPRLFKNGFAVGIPHAGGRTGVFSALALGALLADAEAGLECFGGLTPEILEQADRLVAGGAVTVEVDANRDELYADCRVERAGGAGRAVLERSHTRLVRLERDGRPVALPDVETGVAEGDHGGFAAWLDGLDLDAAMRCARSLDSGDRVRLREGARLNRAMARHGLSLFPDSFSGRAEPERGDALGRLVCAGVHARMSGESLTVMTLAGSGNKGITVSVPLTLRGRELEVEPERTDEALALACLLTSQTTRRLGALSAVCGSSNAAGIGLAAGLVALEHGGKDAIARAIHNMVGNVTGMICDGAKIGCGLKAMTAVDAALRASSFALAGVGIPATDGIVEAEPERSLRNLVRVARHGMRAADAEILRILRRKPR